MRKRWAAFLAALALAILPACSEEPPENKDDDPTGGEKVELSLWTYPIGGWGNISTVSTRLKQFNAKYPNISVAVNVVDYNTGDRKIREVLDKGEAPDLVLEGPERLVADWGANGYMVDIGDLWNDAAAGAIYENVRVACHDGEGKYYIYPMCMTTHCMAINRDLFEEAGAWQYVNAEEHTWTTEGFFNAIAALREHGVETACLVYCGGQGGDQGTRALVTNLYGGTFTDPQHTSYTLDSEENIAALTKLRETDGVVFAPDLVGTDEIEKFCNEEIAMAFCWNVSMEVKQTINSGFDFDVFPMAFPTPTGGEEDDIELQGGIWGFGIFDNGNEARIKAAKTLIRYFMQDDTQYSHAVTLSTYWPVRDMPGLYVNDELMNEYSIFGQYLGDYYQVTPNWTEARAAWWKMLQGVGEGKDVAECVHQFNQAANLVR